MGHVEEVKEMKKKKKKIMMMIVLMATAMGRLVGG